MGVKSQRPPEVGAKFSVEIPKVYFKGKEHRLGLVSELVLPKVCVYGEED